MPERNIFSQRSRTALVLAIGLLSAGLGGCVRGTASAGPTPSTSSTVGPSPTGTVAGPTATALASGIGTLEPAGPSPNGAVWVPGTHVAIVPPGGFSLSTSVAGFDHDGGEASILVSELPASPFDATDANLAAGGFVVKSRDRSSRGGQSRQIFDGEQTINGNRIGRLVLSIGPDDTSALIVADYPLDAPELREQLRTALESVVMDPERAIDPGVAMTFDVTPAPPLRLAGLLGGTAAYNTLGYLHPLDSLVPTMHVRPIEEVPPDDEAAFLETQLDGMRQQLLPGLSAPLQFTINGETATQLISTATDNLHDMNRQLFVYQVVLVHPNRDRYVHMWAVATQDVQDELLPAFKATAESFRWH